MRLQASPAATQFSVAAMALSLEQYADWLAGRNLLWPAPAGIVPPKTHAHLPVLKDIRAVSWNVYGTLLSLASGRLCFEHPDGFVTKVALDKTIREFHMWQSMTRKPGGPAEQLLGSYQRLLKSQEMRGTGKMGEHPEIRADVIWKEIVTLLEEHDYRYDAGFYGTRDEYGQKIALFFHWNLQATQAYEGALETLQWIAEQGYVQVLLSDAQCFTEVQLLRGLRAQGRLQSLHDLFDFGKSALSYREGIRKPSEGLFGRVLAGLAHEGIGPRQVLHVGSRVSDDLAVAKGLGMRTALFAGDKTSLWATKEELRDRATRPKVLLSKLSQLHQTLCR